LLFAGPKVPSILDAYGLDGIVYYGWFGVVSKSMLAILHFFHDSLHLPYAIAIILLTVLVRSTMFPLSRRQAISAQKMQELAPEMKKLAEKYKNNMEARSKAQQELFRKHNYNPLAGCLPMFIQLPIFIGLYRSLSVDVELRQAPLISESVRWASNLAAPDQLFSWAHWMPAFGQSWLGPFFNVLPCITIGLFIWQQKMFMPPPTDEQAAMQQKMMQYMMIFFGVMFFRVPSGLCVYFIASSLWGIAERKLLPKSIKKSSTADGATTISVPSRPATDNSDSNGNGAVNGKKKQRDRK
jgi:YidC/Oxa1 family membrane protein insertase